MFIPTNVQRRAGTFRRAIALLGALLGLHLVAWGAPGLTVTYPNGGETLMIHEDVLITWTASDVTGEVEVEYTVDGSRWRGVGRANATAGTISWRVPNKESQIARVRVVSKKGDVSDESDGVFEIIPNPLDATIMIVPDGGEIWTEGEKHVLNWQAPLDAIDVLLELSTDNGVTWTQVAKRPATPPQFEWTVPHVGNAPIATCVMKVSVAEAPDHFDQSDAPFTIRPKVVDPPPPPPNGSLTITGPNGGERYAVDSTVTIGWSSMNMTGEVQVEYSADGGGQWSGVGKTDVGVGGMLWKIPSRPSANVLVRILSADKSMGDTSDAPFEIYEPGKPNSGGIATVTAPNGGETWTEGESHDIVWQAPDNAKQVMIELSTDGGATWSAVAQVTAASARYAWTIPHLSDSPISNARVRVSVAEKPDVVDMSNGAFTILPKAQTPTLSVNDNRGLGRGGALAIEVYPNPSATVAEARWEQEIPGDAVVELYGVGGERVRAIDIGRREAGEQRLAIEVDDLPVGVYFLRIVSAGHLVGGALTVGR